jgi:hypothetical protein
VRKRQMLPHWLFVDFNAWYCLIHRPSWLILGTHYDKCDI